MQHIIVDRRYKILKKFGAGAMGEVYKVKDLKNNNIVALKLLSKKKTSSESIQRFKREFRLLAELHHPNLCEVYDFGTLKDGRSYFTMEYIAGKDISQAAKGKTHEEIYSWIVQLCRALEYIHAKGLIHYDIKPSNVLIQQSENGVCVKLMDFGLVGEQRIRGGILIRGTLPYIAPEVIKGLAVDHRADLYSLGVLLYEILTRKSLQIEVQSSFATLLKQSRNHIIAKPSKYVAGIPKGLRRLIITLVDNEPAGRFGRANEVIREINKISHTKFVLETEKTVEGYLLSGRFVGRDKEMELLKSWYAKARRGNGRVILIAGDAGIGKSRLLKEFKIYIQTEHGHCIIGYASKDKIFPLEPFYNVFKELMSYIGEMPARFWTKERKLWLAVLFRMFPELTVKRLGKNLPKLVPLDLKQENLRTFGALTELITHCTNQLGEMVILLEDLHWADDVTIQFLEYLGRNLNGKNILICGTSRMTELKENEVFKSIIDNMKKEGYLKHIELKPFTYKNLYSFLNSTITSTSNSSRLTQYFMSKTDGNPFFVEETIRTLLQMGKMKIGKRVEIAKLKKITIPQTVADVALKRIVDLDENSRKIINFAAILLKDFSFDLMKRLTGLEDTESAYSLWELKRRGVLVEQDRRYQFYHAILREALNNQLSYQEKRKLNYQIGKTLEYITKGRLEKVIEDIAYYYINARDRKKGIVYGLRAAEKSSERYANEYAIQLYKEVLKLLGHRESKRYFTILQKLAKIEVLVGRHNDAIKHYKKILNFGILGIRRKLELHDAIGMIYENTGEYNKLLYIYKRAQELSEKMRSGKMKTLWKTRINVKLCTAYLLKGDLKNANKFNFYTLKIPTRTLKEKAEIQLLGRTYGSIVASGLYKARYTHVDYDRLITIAKNSFKYLRKVHDEKYIAVAFTNLAVLYRYKIDLIQAINYYRKGIQAMKKIGDRSTLPVSLYGLAESYYITGLYKEALTYWQEAYSHSQRVGFKLVTAASISALGHCYVKLCRYKQAQGLLEKAMSFFDTMDFQDGKAYSMHALGEVYQAIGNYRKALKCHRKALKISKIMKHLTNIRLAYVNIGLIFLDIGVLSEAEKFINNAVKITKDLRSMIDKIYDYIYLCRISMLKKDYGTAVDYYNKGIKIAKRFRLKPQLIHFYLLRSSLYYYEKKYSKGVEVANKAAKNAEESGTKDLHAEALLMKAKNEIKRGVLSKIEILTILNEAKRIAEEINCPELLWKVYFCYGQFLHKDKQYLKASEYYQKCHTIFKDVGGKIRNKIYQNSYFNHPDRQAVYAATDEIEELVRAGG